MSEGSDPDFWHERIGQGKAIDLSALDAKAGGGPGPQMQMPQVVESMRDDLGNLATTVADILRELPDGGREEALGAFSQLMVERAPRRVKTRGNPFHFTKDIKDEFESLVGEHLQDS